MHKAQCEHDWKQFRAAMDKEWVDQQDHGNYELMLCLDLPPGTPVLPSVWQMK